MNFGSIQAFRIHVESEFPKEACGLLIDISGTEVYRPCVNQAVTPNEHFVISAQDYLQASIDGTIVGVCHSHPNASSHASLADIAACERSNLTWYIMGWPSFTMTEISPAGRKIPLLGRPFVHGIHDCYSLCRDYYEQELGILIPDFERSDEWWEKGQNLYEANFEAAGFQVVAEPRLHDAVLMRIRSPVANHAAVFHKPDAIIHHLYNHLSSETVYGGYWARHTVRFLRHKDLL